MGEYMEPWLLSRFLDSHHLTHLLSHTIVGFILPLQQQNEISIVFSPCPGPWSYIFLSSGKWQIPLQNIIWRWLWQYWLWSFQWRDTKLERFLAKKPLYSNEITGRSQKVPKLNFQGQFFYVKNHRNLSDVFSLKNMN